MLKNMKDLKNRLSNSERTRPGKPKKLNLECAKMSCFFYDSKGKITE